MNSYTLLSCISVIGYAAGMSASFQEMFELGPMSASGVKPTAQFHHEMTSLKDVNRLLSALVLLRSGDLYVYSQNGIQSSPNKTMTVSDNVDNISPVGDFTVPGDMNFDVHLMRVPYSDYHYNYESRSPETMSAYSDYDYSYYS